MPRASLASFPAQLLMLLAAATFGTLTSAQSCGGRGQEPCIVNGRARCDQDFRLNAKANRCIPCNNGNGNPCPGFCGAEGEECCLEDDPGFCDPGLTCDAGLEGSGICLACSSFGEPPCTDGVCQEPLVVVDDLCTVCDGTADGQVPCADQTCDEGLVLENGRCVDDECGGLGERICPDGTCDEGFIQLAPFCVACGGDGEDCCTSGDACTGDLTCSGDTDPTCEVTDPCDGVTCQDNATPVAADTECDCICNIGFGMNDDDACESCSVGAVTVEGFCSCPTGSTVEGPVSPDTACCGPDSSITGFWSGNCLRTSSLGPTDDEDGCEDACRDGGFNQCTFNPEFQGPYTFCYANEDCDEIVDETFSFLARDSWALCVEECGSVDEIPCPDGTCAGDLVVISDLCRSCGGDGEIPCPGRTCDEGLVINFDDLCSSEQTYY